MNQNKRKLNILIVLTAWITATACGSLSETELQATISANELQIIIIQATANAQLIEEGIAPEPITTINNSEENNNNPQPPPIQEGGLGSIQLEEIALSPPEDALFFEDFSNNNNGWGLFRQSGGSASLVQNRLRLQSNDESCMIIPVPNLEVEDDFYAEVLIEPKDEYEYIGIAFGPSPNEFFKYGIQQTRWEGEFLFLQTPNNANNNSTSWAGNLVQSNREFTLGVEATNGLFTIYYNGEALESLMRNISVQNLGVFTCDTAKDSQTYFDNLIVKESR